MKLAPLFQMKDLDTTQLKEFWQAHPAFLCLVPKIGEKSAAFLPGILKHLTGEKEAHLEINKNGKPYWPKHPDVQFNVSNSMEWTLIGFSKTKPIGVDIEGERPIKHLEKLAQRILTEQEQKDLARLPTTEKEKQLFRYWSLKEAILKCEGGGFFAHGHDIGLSLPEKKILSLPSSYGTAGHWQIEQQEFFDGHNHYQISCALKSPSSVSP